MRKIYGVSVKVENDANAAGLAEYIWGAARGYRYVFYATLGTGIGTGIVLDGKIYWGRTGAAAEGGHVTIDWHGPVCNCGKRGCIEILASGPAIAVRAQEKVLEEPRRGAAILQSARGDIEQIHSENVADAWRAGDPLAKEILDETADLLTVWLGNIIDLLEPEVMVFGGGIGELAEPLVRVHSRAIAVVDHQSPLAGNSAGSRALHRGFRNRWSCSALLAACARKIISDFSKYLISYSASVEPVLF